MTTADLDGVKDIDATGESSQYLHIERTGEDLAISWNTQIRPLREKRLHRHALDDERAFALKQIVTGMDEGIALVTEHDGRRWPRRWERRTREAGIFRLIDLRVDFDFRRQGLASAMMFQMIRGARQRDLRGSWSNPRPMISRCSSFWPSWVSNRRVWTRITIPITIW